MLRHGFYWEFPLNSDLFQANNEAIGFPGVYQGFEIQKSLATLNFNLTQGRALLNNGVVVWNDDTFANAGGLDKNTSSKPRIDTIVIEYIHGSDQTLNRPRIVVLQGDPADTPIAKSPNDNQIELGTIYMPPGANDLNDVGVVITNSQRVTYLKPGGFFIRPDVGVEYNATYSIPLKGLVFSSDYRTSTKIPSSTMFMAAKLAMEGIYWGNFTLTHTAVNALSQPTTTTIVLKDESNQPIETITVTYTYDDNARLIGRVFSATAVTLTETLTYDPLNVEKAPNITQVVAYV